MKTIAIFSGYFIPHVGGIESYVNSLSKELITKGYRVIIITSNENNYKNITEDGGRLLLRIPLHNLFKNRYPIPKKNQEYKKIIALLDQEKIDYIIVNTRFHLTSLLGAKYGKKKNIPVSLIEHGSNYVTVNNKLLDFFGHLYEHFISFVIKRYIDEAYGVSKAASKWLNTYKIKSSGEWYNSIDASLKIAKKQQREFTFSYIGRIIKQKGIENILIAFTKLNKENKKIKLIIAGDGNLLPEIKAKYQDNKRITILGRVEKDEVFNILAKTDVFLYPPIWPEGLPSSILEAGLMECAVITTNQGGIAEIITNNQNGLIVDSKVSALYQAMKKVLKNEKLKQSLSERLYKTVTDKFTWDKTSDKIIKEILSKS